jgi:hypothetical protein
LIAPLPQISKAVPCLRRPGGGVFLGVLNTETCIQHLKTVSYDAGADLIKYAAFTYTVDLGYYAVDNVVYTQASQAPEPASFALLGIGLVGLGAMRRRHNTP